MALLGQAASRRPLLVIIDDAQWLDQASMAVLAFAARRGVAGVGFHWAVRSGHTLIERCGVPTHVVGPISNDAAGTLLDSYFPTIAPRVRQRLIVEAAGNPLALMELPTALSAPQLAAVEELPCSLPLTARLQHAKPPPPSSAASSSTAASAPSNRRCAPRTKPCSRAVSGRLQGSSSTAAS